MEEEMESGGGGGGGGLHRVCVMYNKEYLRIF